MCIPTNQQQEAHPPQDDKGAGTPRDTESWSDLAAGAAFGQPSTSDDTSGKGQDNGVIAVGRGPNGERATAPEAYVVWEVTDEGQRIVRRVTTNAKEARLAKEELDRMGKRAYRKEFNSSEDASNFAGEVSGAASARAELLNVQARPK